MRLQFLAAVGCHAFCGHYLWCKGESCHISYWSVDGVLSSERKCAENYTKRHSQFFLYAAILYEKYIYILSLEMASPGNQHCVSCIGTLSFPIPFISKVYVIYSIYIYTYIAVRSLTCHTATGTHMPYRITQCYLPPGRGDIPALTPAEAGTRLSDLGGMQGWVDLVGMLHTEMVEDGHQSKY